MDVNQCSYCGMTAYMEADACPSCQEAMGLNAAVPETVYDNSFENAPVFSNNESLPQTSNSESLPQFPNNEAPPQNFETQNFAPNETQAEFLPETALPMRRPSTADWKRCPICNAGIAQYRDFCSRCATVKPVKQKSGFGKFVYILLILGLFGGGIYYFINSSTPAILRKFSKATGSNGTFAADSFVMKGSSKIVFQPVIRVDSPAYQGLNSAQKYKKEESYQFEFSHKNPNKSLMDFYKMNGSSRESVMSQGFNGTSGWKYAKIFNQPAKLEDAGNGFSDGNIGLGVGDYQSLSELDDASKAEFGSAMGYYRDLVKTFEVEGNTKNSDNKAFLLSKKTKPDGTTEKTLLVFDEESGFMIGMSKYDVVDNKPISTIGLFNNYKKFWVKEKSFFGTKNKFVSIPTVWTFKIGELETLSGTGSFTVNLSLEIDSITMDIPIDDTIFEKPAK